MIEIGEDTGNREGKLDKSEEKKVSSEQRNEGQAKTEERVKGSWTVRKGREEGL